MQFIDLAAQYQRIQAPLQTRLQTVLQHGQYIMGQEVLELEAQLAALVGVDHCIAVSSGTDALLAALMALEIGPGDEVITTPFSFFATVETIALLGAIPVFVDIDPATYNLNPDLIAPAITAKTKAILPVSLYGQCYHQDINAIAAAHGLPVIEDAAQSFGATIQGRRSGSLGTIGCTSFFPSKPLGCYGDGGACFTQDAALAKALRQIRNHGQEQRYQHERLGINGRLDTLQAAVLLTKLEIFEQECRQRQLIGERYSTLLSLLGAKMTNEAEHGVLVPFIAPEHQSVYAQYTLQVDDRTAVLAALKGSGIPTAVHYPIPLHHQPAIAQRFRASALPVAERVAQRVLSLPMHPYLSEVDQQRIVDAVAVAVALSSI